MRMKSGEKVDLWTIAEENNWDSGNFTFVAPDDRRDLSIRSDDFQQRGVDLLL